MSPAGTQLLRFLTKWLDSQTLNAIVEPTLADLQHELQAREHTAWQEVVAHSRAYSGLTSALLLYGLECRTPVKRALTIVGLGLAGGLLYAWTRATVKDPRIFLSAFLLPMCAAPIALRLGGRATSYRRTFTGLFAVGVLVWAISGGFVLASVHSGWMNRAVVSLLNLTGLVALSALGAAAVWTPTHGSIPTARRLVLGLLGSALTTTAVFYLSTWLQGSAERTWAITWPFYAAMFTMPIVATSLPILLIAHRWISTHATLALVGAALSPMAMLVMLYLEMGNAHEVVKCLHDAPSMCVLMTLPFTMGNGVLALILPVRRIAMR